MIFNGTVCVQNTEAIAQAISSTCDTLSITTEKNILVYNSDVYSNVYTMEVLSLCSIQKPCAKILLLRLQQFVIGAASLKGPPL